VNTERLEFGHMLRHGHLFQDFIVDGDEDDEDIGRKQPAKKGRRGALVISDDEDD